MISNLRFSNLPDPAFFKSAFPFRWNDFSLPKMRRSDGMTASRRERFQRRMRGIQCIGQGMENNGQYTVSVGSLRSCFCQNCLSEFALSAPIFCLFIYSFESLFSKKMNSFAVYMGENTRFLHSILLMRQAPTRHIRQE